MIQKLSEATTMASLVASQLRSGGNDSVSTSSSGTSSSSGSASSSSSSGSGSNSSISVGSSGNDVLGLGLGLGLVETVSLVSAVHRAQHEGAYTSVIACSPPPPPYRMLTYPLLIVCYDTHFCRV